MPDSYALCKISSVFFFSYSSEGINILPYERTETLIPVLPRYLSGIIDLEVLASILTRIYIYRIFDKI